MPRIAIVGGGISGLTAAYELEQHRRAGKPLDWFLFEASDRLGGTVSTTRRQTSDGEFILEDGPDGWVTEKPWARDLALELGLGDQIVPCNESGKRTYIWLNDRLTPMPERMRLMVPEDLDNLHDSPLFSAEAKQAYKAELTRAADLKASAPAHDESIASFVLRHFGPEVLTNVAAPLLSGVFGGDVERLSVRAVMPTFVQMEAQHGSIISALQVRSGQRGNRPRQSTFTSLRNGMGSLVAALVAALPADRLQTGSAAAALGRSSAGNWLLRFTGPRSSACAVGLVPFDAVLLATPAHVTAGLLTAIGSDAAELIPKEASSAVLATFCWPAERAESITIPRGFGFLVPPHETSSPHLLAVTFADQKYDHRAPGGSRILRAFFGGASAQQLHTAADESITALALSELRSMLGPLPEPDPALTTVVRWPRSLPQYEVGHPDRIAELEQRIQVLGRLYLLGNGFHGVGVPDLVRDARAAARKLSESLS